MGLETHWCRVGSMLSGKKIKSHTQRKNTGGVCGQVLSAEGHFITLAVLLGCRQSHRGTLCEWLLYTGYVLLSSEENSQIVSHSFFRRL